MTPENFKNHTVFEKLEQLNQILINESTKEKTNIESYSFFESFYNFIISRLKLTIPILVQEVELASLANEIEAGNVQINSFVGNNNIGHINNAVNNFNSALNKIKNLPIPLKRDDFDFSKEVSVFQSSVENAYKELEKINLNLKQDLAKLQSDVEIKETKITELQQKLTTKETEIQNVLASFNTEFDSIKTNNNTIFELEKKKFNEAIENDRKKFGDTFEEQKNTLNTDAKNVIDQLNLKLSEANKIVNIVGNVGVTGNYQNIANQNKKSADSFRWIAMVFMIIMSVLLIWSIIDLSTGEFNIYKSLVRILAAAVLTYPAVYASRESNKHRQLETKNRNIELELASIGPFIELLPDDKKQKIKEDLVIKYFGNNSLQSESKESEEDISISGLEKILKTILPYIKK